MSDHRGLTNLEQAMLRLEDIQEIQRLKYRYFRCVDTANHDELATLLHPDITVAFSGGSYDVRLSGATAFMSFIRDMVHSRIVAQHNGHHPEIDILDATTAHGRWYLSDTFIDLDNCTKMSGAAIYEDDYEKVDGRWLLRHTAHYRIFEVLEKLEQAPLLQSHLLGEKGLKHPSGVARILQDEYGASS